ncbi:hypothetical protein CMO88_04465 [Candidatus Woesearchaeota archaeon]|nr:hypothetical protein [Candidatus Woesearchaeota archaeon]|tara:strand:+ start:2912 stop:3847 length:936 start_codon:yes stop_codon:yes gene_type:complete
MAEENKLAQQVLEIVKLTGPVIPTQISKEIGKTSILASALLSELASNNSVKISNVKVGGTPLYYAPGQEEKLQDYIKYLHEKERKAYELLKTEKVLRDKILEPVMRVALRQIKDFAFPLNVQSGNDVEIFWKWYLITNDEAEPKIKQFLEAGAAVQEVKVPEPIKAEKIEPVKEVKTPKPLQGTQKTIEIPKKAVETIPKPKKTVKKDSGEFVKKIMEYFSNSNIEVLERVENKKKTEAEFLINVPSPVGSIKYYCKVKDKKSSNDGDLSTAMVQGQSRNLPVLFLTTGKFTKKATAMLEKEFSNINVKNL